MITLRPADCDQIQVSLFVVPPEGSFKLLRFAPTKNNVRSHDDAVGQDIQTTYGTPLYNSSVLFDLTLEANYKFLETSLAGFAAGHRAAKLALVWLRGRNVMFAYDAILDMFVLYVMAHLRRCGKLTDAMDVCQVIRVFWTFVSGTDWRERLVAVGDVKSAVLKLEFKNSFDVVFVDNSGLFNLAAFLNRECYGRLRQEAKFAIGIVGGHCADPFHALFYSRKHRSTEYDAVLR